MTSPRDPTQFTRESAERIANVVRAAELASPRARSLGFDRVDSFRRLKVFRVCTFTGAWPINTDKVVTFKYETNEPNTAVAKNLFFPVRTSTAARDCAIAQEGTAWFLIGVKINTATATIITALREIECELPTLIKKVEVLKTIRFEACALVGEMVTIGSVEDSFRDTLTVISGTATATYLTLE